MTLLSAPRAPLIQPPAPGEPVSTLEDTLRVEVGLEDAVALPVEVGVGTQLDRLPVEEDDGLEEGVAGAANADLLDPSDARAVEGDLPLAGPPGVELGLGDGEAVVHASTLTLAARRARGARVKALYEDGLKPAAIAQRLGMSERQVQRWLTRLVGEGWQQYGRVSAAQRARILVLAADQVPPGWISEDVGRSRRLVDLVREEAQIEIDAEWASIRRQIQARPELFELHLQFMPQRLRRA